jgi:maltooligosyltrehalose trehalohydrolase
MHSHEPKPWMEVGARCSEAGASFTVWAPAAGKVSLKIISPGSQTIPMTRAGNGYWRAEVDNAFAGCTYMYSLDGGPDRPDPASYYQPRGVHHESQVVDHRAFAWSDSRWQGIPLAEMIQYELHVGAFTPQGDFGAVIPRLEILKELGINALEIMPVSQFPGSRNWGYDGVNPYAVQNTYGGPDEFKRLIDAAHAYGIAVILDVVYNHLGPEGNYFHEFGPYFTGRYMTPWGQAVNYDGPDSDPVRGYFIENALFWLRDYHIDGLRLDAVHGIFDASARPFLRELAEEVARFSAEDGRERYLIAESNLNDIKITHPHSEHGFGIHAQWNDDFHHALHCLMTGESIGYYIDYGSVDDLVKALRDGFVYDWRYSPFRKRRYGSSSVGVPGDRFVISTQTHDQVGNRLNGDRLSTLVSFEELKIAAATMILSPYIPMLFMGEEYAEDAPFLYFVSHTDEDLAAAVRDGRREEFADFEWNDYPPDPQAEETFVRSRLDWDKHRQSIHAVMWNWHRKLIELRRSYPALSRCRRDNFSVGAIHNRKAMRMLCEDGGRQMAVVINFDTDPLTIPCDGEWETLLDAGSVEWGGTGSDIPRRVKAGASITLQPRSLVVLEQRR